jgi:type I restriction enzyme S subunit
MKTFEFGELVELRKEKYNPLTNDTVPCIELEHINQNSGTINGFVNSIEQKSIKNVFHKGDILFAKLRPYLRKYWFAEFDGVCSSEIWVLKPKSVVTAEYLFCLIQTEEFIRIANVSFGSKMPRADWDFINHYPFTIIHSLPEQQHIVSVLSLWDTAIAKQTAMIEQLTLRKRGLMQQLLTGKKRLKGFEGEWKKCVIKSFAEEVSTRNIKNKNYVVLSCTKYDGLVPSLEYFGKQIYSNDLNTYKVVPKNHFVYATNHIDEGSIGYQAHYDNGLISPMYTVFKTDKEKVDDTYLFAVLKSHHLIYLYQAMMEGSINRRGGLRWDSFSTIKVDLPSLEEQKAISAFLQNADKEIEIQKQKLAAMQEQKKGLMQVLLTGKKRVH